ncbi:Alkane 1-monooxygenase 2 [Aquimixticola soesokkakensis]|uniref:Alkane 1-monooxygenase 2 n=1 Tax=Aquimixticola soesokkakensis TaxID=1519096 RepID=A0A1Y5TS42_9RHOB|nr:alkane 1-monooxygenase [Aquimixticola soesokkakensis]SLN68850.1 Alkane 1-monooxygenase 2 [Aquimixticola soesokkakensis]
MNRAQISPRNALPFWMSLGVVPLVLIGARLGGAWPLLVPAYAWWMTSLLDVALGQNDANPDIETPDSALTWYRAVTLIWFPVQLCLIFATLAYASWSDHLVWWEKLVLFFSLGVSSGSIGIVYAHELLHQGSKLERWLGDLLLASVMYSHFRTEHLLVHHRHVGTRRDAVTALYNEGFHRYFWRVLRECPRSAWQAEAAMLARRGLSPWSPANPHFRYWALQCAFLIAALLVGGVAGLGWFLFQAFVAIWQLELTNYVEHYGLTREHLGNGKYEWVKPRHSWNSAQTASNWLLINLQRHSDHHYRPDRRFPLLQTYAEDEAPQLPHGYPLMTTLAMIPPLWRRRMNPLVRAWRRKYYPHIEDWSAYKAGTNPLPRL